MEEIRGSWKRLYNLKVHNFSYSPNIIMVLKPLRIGWARNTARLGEAKKRIEKFNQTCLKEEITWEV
jgi:hypothetical protein